MKQQIKSTKIFSLLLAAFLFVNLAGLNLTANSMADGMNDCPVMQGMNSLCAMGLVEHISAWFNMMAGVLPGLLMVLAVSAAVNFVSVFSFSAQLKFLYSPARQRWRNSLLQLFIPLKFALSRGLIQPKIYS